MFETEITKAEWAVLELLAEGFTPLEISQLRRSTLDTVRYQLRKLRCKIHVDTNVRLVVWYYQRVIREMAA